MVAVKPTKTLDPTGGLPADWVPPVSVNGYDVVLASRSSVTDAGKESEGVGRREAGGRRGRRKEEEGARKKEPGLDFSQLLSKVTQDTAIRFCRKVSFHVPDQEMPAKIFRKFLFVVGTVLTCEKT